jgi:2-polyprenyl-3-methyl-5-hydroxy-6-metoxy-1,4-benzoquinol methylase
MSIDLSSRAIEIAKQRNIDAEFLAADFCKVDLPGRSFDIGIVFDTIGNVADPPAFIEKLAHSIRPCGYLILTCLNKFVYRRRSDIRPPEPGEVRKWLSRRGLFQLLRSRFRVLRSTTLLPAGHRGILRFVNSYKINGILNRVFSGKAVVRAKEMLGLGHCRLILAQRVFDVK